MAKALSVILAKDVPNLGNVGSVAKVRLGYARNFLIPRGLAVVASTHQKKQYEHQQRLVTHRLRELRIESEKIRDRLSKLSLSIFAKSGPQGKLFGSVGPRNIEKELQEAGFTISHRDIKLEAPIKTVGNFKVPVRLEADVMAEVAVMVLAIQDDVALAAADSEGSGKENLVDEDGKSEESDNA